MATPKTPRPSISSLADRLRGALATFLFAPLFANELAYWHLERLYWEGIIHPDGGDDEEQARIQAAEGAQIAVRRVADLAGVRPHAIPNHASANATASMRCVRT